MSDVPQLGPLLRSVFSTVLSQEVLIFLLQLLLYLFIFAISYNVGFGLSVPDSFGSFFSALISSYQAFMGDDFLENTRTHDEGLAVMLWLLVSIVGATVLMNVFIAVVSNVYEESIITSRQSYEYSVDAMLTEQLEDMPCYGDGKTQSTRRSGGLRALRHLRCRHRICCRASQKVSPDSPASDGTASARSDHDVQAYVELLEAVDKGPPNDAFIFNYRRVAQQLWKNDHTAAAVQSLTGLGTETGAADGEETTGAGGADAKIPSYGNGKKRCSVCCCRASMKVIPADSPASGSAGAANARSDQHAQASVELSEAVDKGPPNDASVGAKSELPKKELESESKFDIAVSSDALIMLDLSTPATKSALRFINSLPKAEGV